MSCNSCEMLNINGVNCHEQGCPEAWRDQTAQCFICGCDFKRSYPLNEICEDCTNDQWSGEEEED